MRKVLDGLETKHCVRILFSFAIELYRIAICIRFPIAQRRAFCNPTKGGGPFVSIMIELKNIYAIQFLPSPEETPSRFRAHKVCLPKRMISRGLPRLVTFRGIHQTNYSGRRKICYGSSGYPNMRRMDA